jgi:hypothetical protein
LQNVIVRGISALSVACVLAATATGTALFELAAPVDSSRSSVALQQDDAPPFLRDSKNDLLAAIEVRKSYWIPAAQIVGLDFQPHEFNRHFVGDEYKCNLSSVRHNLRSSRRTDTDPFIVNQQP